MRYGVGTHGLDGALLQDRLVAEDGSLEVDQQSLHGAGGRDGGAP